jgi:GNAT superfamily N-acetyltransferase
MENITIREGERKDIPAVFGLIKELALYEKAPYEVENTPAQMAEDAFGDQPLFGFFVAEVEDQVVGMAIYYFRYSTWKGKRLYLEDIYIKEEHRGKGIGNLLFDALVEVAQKTRCNGLSFQVLNWNEPAINFYKKLFVTFDNEWTNCSLNRQQLEQWKFSK